MSILKQKTTINQSYLNQETNIGLISKKLNDFLLLHSISVKLLSSSTSISVAIINALRRGVTIPSIGVLIQLSNFFGISLSEFLGLKVEPKNSLVDNNSTLITVYNLDSIDKLNNSFIAKKILIEVPTPHRKREIFGAVLTNNCEMSLYNKNTIFVISVTNEYVDGDVVLIKINNSINNIKRIYRRSGFYQLRNLDLTEVIDVYPRNEVQILGVVIQIIQPAV